MIKAVVFDLDGTITRPFLNFKKIRVETGAGMGRNSLLDEIESMDPAKRRKAMAILERHEREAAQNAELNQGVTELLAGLAERGLRTAIFTRNSALSTELVSKKLDLRVDGFITRDSGFPIKPDPAALFHLCREWGVEPGEVLMVGDFRYDIEAGKAAGTFTCLVTNGGDGARDADPDYLVEHPGQILDLVRSLNGGS